jgi:hypothetical protein
VHRFPPLLAAFGAKDEGEEVTPPPDRYCHEFTPPPKLKENQPLSHASL